MVDKDLDSRLLSMEKTDSFAMIHTKLVDNIKTSKNILRDHKKDLQVMQDRFLENIDIINAILKDEDALIKMAIETDATDVDTIKKALHDQLLFYESFMRANTDQIKKILMLLKIYGG